jgi:hypothetical protein
VSKAEQLTGLLYQSDPPMSGVDCYRMLEIAPQTQDSPVMV